MADVRSRHGENQVDQHAAVQGEGIDRTLIHHLAHAGILSLEQFTHRKHGNCLGVGADTQLQVDGCLLAHFELNGLRGLLESGAVNRQ